MSTVRTDHDNMKANNNRNSYSNSNTKEKEEKSQLTFAVTVNSDKMQQMLFAIPSARFKTSPSLSTLSCLALVLACAFSLLVPIANCDQFDTLSISSNPRRPSLTPLGNGPQQSRSTRLRRGAYADAYSSPTALGENSAFAGLDVDALGARFNSYVLPARYEPQMFQTRNVLGVDQPQPMHGSLSSMSLVSGTREDICKFCTCARTKNAFLSISCDFQKKQKTELPAVFGSNLKVPGDATSITIRLAPNTDFRLERGFFHNNTVNSLTIEGTYSESEQVEITTEAFVGNNGPYPEINVHNVFSVVVRTRAISDNAKFTVRNSNDLILFPDAFENAKINGLFVGINDLRIQEKAFNSAQAKLRIESSYIDNIYRFEASLREIRFINCTIGTINGGTFDVITINSIVFESCRIDHIKARAITEKLYSNHVSITGAIIGSIESEAIYGSGIAELVLTRNKIDTIQDNAIHVTALNATISHNNIKHLGQNWLHVQEWSNILIERNQFGIFGSMHLENTKQPQSCRFTSNSITKPLPGSLNITNPYCLLREISINLPCRCNLDWLHELSAHDLRSETYCTIDDKLGRCFNATTFNVLKYLNEVCDEAKTTLDCVANQNLKKIKGHFFTPEELERHDQQIPQLYIYIAACLLLLLVLLCLIAVIACRFCRRRSKHLDESGNFSSPPHLHEFSSSELQVIEQTMRLMQKKYPKIYRQVKDHCQTLLESNLPERRCIKTISKIVNVLDKAENSGDDFVAFNRLLTQHMQPRLPTAPPSHMGDALAIDSSIYSEPGFTGDGDGNGNGGFYRSATIVGVTSPHDFETGNYAINNISDTIASNHGQSNLPEHIYAEPNCQQEPLLRNEYASPADRNLDSADLYSEPFTNDRDLVSSSFGAIESRVPQYAQPKRNQRLPATPATARPAQLLPDVLFESSNVALAAPNNAEGLSVSVRQRAQHLQNRPEFDPNKLIPSSGTQWPRSRQLVAPTSSQRSPEDITDGQSAIQARLATPECIENDGSELDLRGATALPQDSSSNHSGGSKETVKIDDIIEYVDA